MNAAPEDLQRIESALDAAGDVLGAFTSGEVDVQRKGDRSPVTEADFAVASNPEFLREGAAIRDFKHPDRIVVGIEDERARDVMTEVYRPLYLNKGPLMFTSRRTAELIKYACNSFHGMKVAFANEMGTLARHAGVDGQELMRLFAEDGVLNVSGAYLRPGMAFGGSCLPKDLRAFLHLAKTRDVSAPRLFSFHRSRR